MHLFLYRVYVEEKPRNLRSLDEMAAPLRLVFVLAVAFSAVVSESHDEHGGEVSFSYSGSNGPENWGSLCGNGKTQSPINIVTKDVVKNSKLRPLVRYYNATNATLVNNGYNLGMKYSDDVGVLNVEGKNYSLTQMHWHTPSEHQIDGQQFPAELHLVHMSEQGELAVVGILFKDGKSDPFLSKLKEELEELGKERCEKEEESRVEIEKVKVKYLRKNNKKFYRYMGSLTTPPCSENVMWNVLTKLRTISKEQVELLQGPLEASYKNNFRPVQPLNGRQVELYNKSEEEEEEEEDGN